MSLRRALIPTLLTAILLAVPLAGSAGAYSTGIGDQQTEMFTDSLWTSLHTRIARYVAPYDAAVLPDERAATQAWISAALARHQQVLVAFYHSGHTPTRMPSVKSYTADVQAFIKLFPQVKQYQAWNETNRGNVHSAGALFHSPSASQAAAYYKALRGVCHGCQITGLDILDQNNFKPTLRYLSQFRSALRRLHVATPHLWGLHNYSDTNRFSSKRTRAILRAVPGQVWLTETGGIVKFGRDFPNRNGSGDKRAAKALAYMFRLAASNRRITRLYIFQWSGASAVARFDAGLLDLHYKPRPGYVIVCRKLHGNNCKAADTKH